ncbi:MAG: 6-phosphofructokinase [Acidimicrobiia bacterium]
MGRIGVMTAGGDCPGLNAAIRATVARLTVPHGREVVGILNGWQGLISNDVRPLDRDSVRGIVARGGTILGTSRIDPYVHANGYQSIRPTLEQHDIERVIVIGGEGTLASALELEGEGLHVIGVPKTIDNDIPATDLTFGFHTAVQIASDAVDRLTTTAESHNRVMLVEVMGRNAGWIALFSGISSGADVILIPEVPYDLDEVCRIILERHQRGGKYSVVVVAEGVPTPDGSTRIQAMDALGFPRLGGVAYDLAPIIEEGTSFETRVTILGHIQRGGTPTAFDRVLATRFGVAAADLAATGASGVMVALRGDRITPVPLHEACDHMRGVDPKLYEVAKTFFG